MARKAKKTETAPESNENATANEPEITTAVLSDLDIAAMRKADHWILSGRGEAEGELVITAVKELTADPKNPFATGGTATREIVIPAAPGSAIGDTNLVGDEPTVVEPSELTATICRLVRSKRGCVAINVNGLLAIKVFKALGKTYTLVVA